MNAEYALAVLDGSNGLGYHPHSVDRLVLAGDSPSQLETAARISEKYQ